MRLAHLTVSLSVFFCSLTSVLGQTPTAEQILGQFRPKHLVEHDTPDAKEFAKCRVEIERNKDSAGFVVFGPAGQVLRRFTDTNGDNKADLFRYYRMGLEVYREIDSDFNEKADQHRWMNWGGMRWGLDKNEDGKIDEWKTLSAQEAARIAVESMIVGDVKSLTGVLINANDIRRIQANSKIGEKLTASVKDIPGQLKKTLASSKSFTQRSKWVRFDPPVPSLIPKEDGKAKIDLTVFENAMAIVENGDSHELVSIGEMVKIGNVWKLVQVPTPLDAENSQIEVGGILMQPNLPNGAADAPPEMAKELEELLATLQKLDESSPAGNVTPPALAKYNHQRADVIERIIRIVPTDQERAQWIQQFADGMAAAVQTGEYDAGLQRLKTLQDQVKANDELLGYVWYRRLLAEYAVRLNVEDVKDRQEVQTWWLKQLEQYAEKWPRSVDASDAIAQLAISLELMGRIDDAKRWYGRLSQDYSKTNAGIRAQGALRRLNLTGKALQLEGRSLQGQPVSSSQYRGKVTLVAFWATWAKPYTDDLPKIIEIHKKYQRSGFEILGVNLDPEAASLGDYLKKNGGNWQHIHEEGGTDGKLARDYGIISVPTMFIVDKTGRVAGAVTAENLEYAVQTLLQGKALDGAARQGSAANPAPRN